MHLQEAGSPRGDVSGCVVSGVESLGARFEEGDLQVHGVIRFWMPEDDVDFPLWDDDGLLPEEPELLESGLGISPALVADLQAWGARWNDTRPTPQAQADAGRELLRTEANALVERMRSELRVGLRVVVDLG